MADRRTKPGLTEIAMGLGGWTPTKATKMDWVEILAGLPLFAGVSKRQLGKVANLAQVVEFERGSVVTQFGETGDAFYLILAGRAKVMGRRGAGRVFREGDFFGEMALLDGEPRSATVTAATELQAMRIPHRAFLKVLEQEPRLAVAMLRELAKRIRGLQRQADV